MVEKLERSRADELRKAISDLRDREKNNQRLLAGLFDELDEFMTGRNKAQASFENDKLKIHIDDNQDIVVELLSCAEGFSINCGEGTSSSHDSFSDMWTCLCKILAERFFVSQKASFRNISR